MSVTEPSRGRDRSVIEAFIGILMGLLVAVLSTSVVNTSLPAIAADLGGGQATLTWIAAGPVLAVTVSTPIWGRAADLVGRKPLLLFALLVFGLATAAAGLAPDAGVLIGARIVQGVTTGGLITLSQIALSDIISPRDRGRYMGVMGAVVTAGTAGGPLLGGLVADTVGWRWNFFVLVPFAVASIAVIALRLRVPRMRLAGRLDRLGAALLTVAVSTLLVWLTLAGSSFAWGSPVSIALGAGSAMLLAATVVHQLHSADPVLPLRMFRHRTFALAVIASFCVGVVLYSVSVYFSQYLQLGRGATAGQAGLATLPQVVANLLASTITGTLVSRLGSWKPWLVLGCSLITAGTVLLATLGTHSPFAVAFTATALLGLGLGMTLQNLVLVVQNASDPRSIGASSSAVAFFRSFGGALAIGVFGSILGRSTAGRGPDAYADAVGSVFALAVPSAAVALICVLFIRNAPLKTKTGLEQIADLDP